MKNSLKKLTENQHLHVFREDEDGKHAYDDITPLVNQIIDSIEELENTQETHSKDISKNSKEIISVEEFARNLRDRISQIFLFMKGMDQFRFKVLRFFKRIKGIKP